MSATWLYTGAASLFVAALTLLGYEYHAWRTDEEATISTIVRRWDRGNIMRRVVVFAAITVVAMSIQFLAIHFIFESIG
jgi:hypothetical protein